MFKVLSKVLYLLAFVSIILSVWVYQTNPTLGTFIGLWVPTLLLVGPSCPWRNECPWRKD